MRMRRNWKGQANPRTVLLAGPFKAPKSRNRLGKPPVMTEREAEGVALLTRVWGRHSRSKVKPGIRPVHIRQKPNTTPGTSYGTRWCWLVRSGAVYVGVSIGKHEKTVDN